MKTIIKLLSAAFPAVNQIAAELRRAQDGDASVDVTGTFDALFTTLDEAVGDNILGVLDMGDCDPLLTQYASPCLAADRDLLYPRDPDTNDPRDYELEAVWVDHLNRLIANDNALDMQMLIRSLPCFDEDVNQVQNYEYISPLELSGSQLLTAARSSEALADGLRHVLVRALVMERPLEADDLAGLVRGVLAENPWSDVSVSLPVELKYTLEFFNFLQKYDCGLTLMLSDDPDVWAGLERNLAKFR